MSETTNATGTSIETVAVLRRALRASDARFKAIVQRSGDGIMVLNREGVIQFVNPSAQRLLGRTQEELVGTMFGVPIIPGDCTEIDIIRGGRPAGVAEMRFVETEWKRQPAYLATLRDVTLRKCAEEDARKAVRRRDQFIATLSHELRNPLAAIANAAQVLCAQGNAGHETLEILQRQSKQMSRLLDDLLDVSRVSQNKIKLDREPVDLNLLADEIGQCFVAQLRQRGIALSVQSTGERFIIDGDSVRLQQVFANLLNNAAKYTPAGGAVTISLRRDDSDAVIAIRDTGIGIRHEMLGSIFEPFVQDNDDPRHEHGGLGIGLALVAKLVECHDGVVIANSEGLGKGSEFIVRIPLSSSEQFPEERVPEEMAAPVSTTAMKIVIVEDNADVRETLKMILEFDGHEIAVAEDGLTGVEVIQLQHPDVALVDLVMPGLDGLEVARRVRSDAENADIFLIALTGYGQANDFRQTKEAGFDAHLVKPVELAKLSALIASHKVRSKGTPARL